MWKVIFTGAVCLALAIGCGALGVMFYRETPWASAAFAAVDAGIVFGGLKIVLDTTKTANELRKISLEIRKLQMEIGEKQQAAAKARNTVVLATLEEIREFALPTLRRTASSSTRSAAIITSIVMVVGIGTFLQKSHQFEMSPPPPKVPESTGPSPSMSSPGKVYPSLPSPSGRIDLDANEAAELASLAKHQYSEGDYCAALSSLDKAIKMYPDQKYLRLQKNYRSACSSQH